jgi:hypothetical protein
MARSNGKTEARMCRLPLDVMTKFLIGVSCTQIHIRVHLKQLAARNIITRDRIITMLYGLSVSCSDQSARLHQLRTDRRTSGSAAGALLMMLTACSTRRPRNHFDCRLREFALYIIRPTAEQKTAISVIDESGTA